MSGRWTEDGEGFVPSANLPHLETCLYRLVHDRRLRRAFIAGEWPVSPELAGELATIDKEELERAARTICRDLLYTGSDAGGGRLTKAFGGTLQRLDACGLSNMEVTFDFVASEHYEEARENRLAGVGMSLEEAFCRFVAERCRDQGREGVREDAWAVPAALRGPLRDLARHEFLATLFQVLTANDRFACTHPAVSDNGSARYLVAEYATDSMQLIAAGERDRAVTAWLYATSRGRFISGRVPGIVRDMLERGREDDIRADIVNMAAGHGTSPAAILRWVDKLSGLHLIRPISFAETEGP
jgi:hypothetical protein